MSLTSHLENPTSPIGQFIKQRFAHTINLTKTANQQLRSVQSILPVQADKSYPYGTIGAAIDYRIRYAFAITPYQRFVAWLGAMVLALKPLESYDDVPIEWDELIGMRIPFDVSAGVAQGPYPLKLIKAFFASLDDCLDAIQPVGKRLEPEAELTLARYCYLLSLFESAFRSDRYMLGPLMMPEPKRSVEELFAIPQDICLEDLAALFNRFYEGYQHLLTAPHVLNPTFAGSNDIGGADADLIVNGCLIDIKTSKSPKIDSMYLYQLAGYLLLDYDDKFHIESLAIYMARQGLLLTWSVPEFLRQLTQDENITLTSLRQEFRGKLQVVRRR